MVHGQQVPVLVIELLPALGADETMDPEGLLPVIGIGRGRGQSLQFPYDLFGAFAFRGHVRLRFPDLDTLPVSQCIHLPVSLQL